MAHRFAAAGFGYLGYRDIVQCSTCHGRLKNWDITDDPFIQHMRFFPDCQFARIKVDRYLLRQAFEALHRMETEDQDRTRAAIGEDVTGTWVHQVFLHAKHN